MKYFYVIVSLVLTVSGNAQNWSLVMPNDTLVYEKQDNHQFFTVWVDSTHVNGTDTTYFMNRISPGEFIAVDSVNNCYPLQNWNIYTSKTMKTRPQFSGGKIQVFDSNSIVWYGSKSFTMYPKNAIGTSWICDSVSMDSMRVLSIDTAFLPIYQTVDSVKLFEFKNHTFRLSKNYGLLSLFDLGDSNAYLFQNVGVQNLHLGEIIPMTKDIFDFEVGDIFYRKYGGGDSDEVRTTTSKTRILSKTLTLDSVFYTVQINSQLSVYSSQGSPHYYPNNQYNTILKYSIHDSISLLNAFPGELAKTIDSEVLTSTFVFRNDANQIEKRSAQPLIPWPTIMEGICNYDSFLVVQPIAGPSQIFVQNLGMVSEVYDYGLQYYSNNLIGYIKANGETWGIITFTSVSEIDLSNQIHIYPNPTKDFITIETEKLNGISILEMYDLQGRIVITKTFNTRLKLDVSNWAKGIYFTVIKNENGAVIHRQKVVVQ